MKNFTQKVLLINAVVLIFASSIFAQGDMMTKEEKLVGSSSDFLIGIHTGIFDCNQTYKYPFNVGVLGQYNYTPNVMKNWFMGAEFGAFYTQGTEDDNLRELGAMIGHLSVYPGYTFTFGKKEYPEVDDFESKMNSKKLKLAAGLTIGLPLNTSSTGSTYDPDNADFGFGFTAMAIFELSQRISFFGSMTRVGADMDGFGEDPLTGESTTGNEHKVSYWGKIGVAYNLLGN